MEIQKTYRMWTESPYFDEETRQELALLAEDEDEIADRFYRNLEFGTGGLRGVIGAGTNRMNIYTVRKATQGLANYINRAGILNKSVAIAYDSRHKSSQFAEEAALCLAANGIRAFIFPGLRPTPVLSFALRRLGCTAGIAVTASHNPARYNGYKVYWEDGGQITPPRDREIIEEVNAVTDFGQVRTMPREAAKEAGLYVQISSEVDDAYIEALKQLPLCPQMLKEEAGRLKIVYSPLHGTGNLPVRRILKEFGFTQVYVVTEQELPDGDFPTVSSPNPEDGEAFLLALKLARQVDADLVFATDPDADRLGVYAKDRADGTYRSFTGNMTGMLILEYILSRKKESGTLPDNGAVVTTIVSGKMAKPITEEYGVKRIETLTGFKYIGEQIRLFERDHSYEFLFGYEESYGCLVGTQTRDKDAVAAVLALCEVAAWCRRRGMTLCDQMNRLFQKYGFYRETLHTVTWKGQDGANKIAAVMEEIRNSVPERIGTEDVLWFADYKKGVRTDLVSGKKEPTGLLQSNVLYFGLKEDGFCCIRPSGTEPKIKFYIGVKAEHEEAAECRLQELQDALLALAKGE